jgi:hypothetical protein
VLDMAEYANGLLRGVSESQAAEEEVCCATDGCMSTDDLVKCGGCGLLFCSNHISCDTEEAICDECREANEDHQAMEDEHRRLINEDIRAINREIAAERRL